MPEAGGEAAQAGIFYQNSVAALALANLLDLDPRIARERVVDVRLEAPEDVDDIVIRFADGHHNFQSVKLSIGVGNSSWLRMWRSLSAQYGSSAFEPNDDLTIVVEKQSAGSRAVAELCERAAASVDELELRPRLTTEQRAAFASILSSDTAAYEVLRRITVMHLPLSEIARELGRRRVAGGQAPPPALLPVLRDMAGGEARRRACSRRRR